MVQHRTDAAQLLAAARPPRPTVHEVGYGRAMAGAAARIVAIKHQHASVMSGNAQHEFARNLPVVGAHGGNQRA